MVPRAGVGGEACDGGGAPHARGGVGEAAERVRGVEGEKRVTPVGQQLVSRRSMGDRDESV